jgi:hypothetical protein
VWLALIHMSHRVNTATIGRLANSSARWASPTFYEMVIAAVWFIFWLVAGGAAAAATLAIWVGWWSAYGSLQAFVW